MSAMMPRESNTELSLQRNVAQLGQYLQAMGQLMQSMQRRLDEMEARQKAVTVSHADVKRLQAMIRGRAADLCRKYDLNGEGAKALRTAIKQDLLRRYQVKDLHDLPESGWTGVLGMVGSWVNIRLCMELRERERRG